MSLAVEGGGGGVEGGGAERHGLSYIFSGGVGTGGGGKSGYRRLLDFAACVVAEACTCLPQPAYCGL